MCLSEAVFCLSCSHCFTILTQRKLMNLNNRQRMACRRLSPCWVVPSTTTCPQQVLTAHPCCFRPSTDPNADSYPPHWGRWGGTGKDHRGWPAEMWRLTAALWAQCEQVWLCVAGSLALAQRVCGSGAAVQTVNTQHTQKSFLKLLAGAWVDDWVDTAVEVPKPEGDFEDRVWGPVSREDGSLRNTHTYLHIENYIHT